MIDGCEVVLILKPVSNYLVKITHLKIRAGYFCLNDLHVRIFHFIYSEFLRSMKVDIELVMITEGTVHNES
jgi:hypothetical protein